MRCASAKLKKATELLHTILRTLDQDTLCEDMGHDGRVDIRFIMDDHDHYYLKESIEEFLEELKHEEENTKNVQ